MLTCLFWLSKAYYIPESREGPQVLHPRMFGHGGLRPALESSAYAKNLTGKREIKPSNSSVNSSLPNFVVYSDRWTSNIGPPPVSEIKVCFKIHVISLLILIHLFPKGFQRTVCCIHCFLLSEGYSASISFHFTVLFRLMTPDGSDLLHATAPSRFCSSMVHMTKR